jgi:hypothetical protein
MDIFDELLQEDDIEDVDYDADNNPGPAPTRSKRERSEERISPSKFAKRSRVEVCNFVQSLRPMAS